MVAGTIGPSDRVINIGMVPESEHMFSLDELDEKARRGETIVGLDEPEVRREYEIRYRNGKINKGEGPGRLRRF